MYAGDRGGEFEAPDHSEFIGNGGKGCAKGCDVKAIERPFDAHEEKGCFVILMLVGMDDVGAVLVEHAGDAGDKTFAIGAVDEQNSGLCHAEGCKSNSSA